MFVPFMTNSSLIYEEFDLQMIFHLIVSLNYQVPKGAESCCISKKRKCIKLIYSKPFIQIIKIIYFF